MKKRLIMLLAVICLTVILLPMTVSAATPENGWYQDGEDWYYYQNSTMVTETVMQIGSKYYGFDESGIMYDDMYFYWNGDYYCAKAGGSLYVNEWMQPKGQEDWYYFGAGGKVLRDFQKIGSTWYFFWENGVMASNEVVWSDIYETWYVISPDGKGSTALTKAGWHKAYDEWYYLDTIGEDLYALSYTIKDINGVTYGFNGRGHMMQNEAAWAFIMDYETDGMFLADETGAIVKNGWKQIGGKWYYAQPSGLLYRSGVYTIGDKQYYFDDDGTMVTNQMVEYYDYESGYYRTVLVGPSGAVVENGWAQSNGNWYYIENNELYTDGIFEIGGKLYYFYYDGRMCATPGTFHFDGNAFCVRDTGGSLLRNEWWEIVNGDSYERGWAYYNEWGHRVWDGILDIKGNVYVFANGLMLENEVYQADNSVYILDASGKGSVADGWFEHPETKDKMYAKDGQLFSGGIYTIGDDIYAFDYFGKMITNDYYDSNLFGADGKMITTVGWHKIGGNWYYVENASGDLACDWQTIGGKLYYFYPAMASSQIKWCYNDETWYAFDNSGAATKLSGNGWTQIGYGRIYLEDGQPLAETWKQIDGNWYYFTYLGEPTTDGIHWIDDEPYMFDADGKWIKTGWFDGYYIDDGEIPTGLKTIDGKQYLFDSEGRVYLYYSFVEYDGKYYWINSDGSVKMELTAGWNEFGGKKYYFDEEERELLRNALLRNEEGIPTHGFGSDYAMCANGLQYAWYDYYMFDANGNLLTGWQKIDGKWYYADPESDDPFIYNNGIYTIDGADYYFKDGYMQTGTLMTEYSIVTTDSSGRIVDQEDLPDGWHYVDGKVVYQKDGNRPTGWVGNYYVEDGYMKVNEIFTYNGNYYFAGKDGQYIKNGWYKVTAGEMVAYLYARADGSLYCYEWLKVGNTYYYFDYVTMVSDTTIAIDGKYHSFDASGKWLGEVKTTETEFPVKPDGWQKIGGKWYYYHADKPLTNDWAYINGTWYSFDYEGVMIANASDGEYYYTASGARATYVGWQKLGGEWYYFHEDHRFATGLTKIGNGYYFFGYNSITDISGYGVMLTNTCIYDNGFYIFGSNGYCAGPETGTGWRQCGSDWYYVVNGRLITNEGMKINGKLYAFDYDGKMVTNALYHVETASGYGYMCFDANGVAVTKTGWYQLPDGWIYVGSNGFAYDGMYKINGKTYSFLMGYWVQ